jgi:hypothetical protein
MFHVRASLIASVIAAGVILTAPITFAQRNFHAGFTSHTLHEKNIINMVDGAVSDPATSLDGVLGAARLKAPYDCVVHPTTGTLYLAGGLDHTIRIIDPIANSATTWLGQLDAAGTTPGSGGSARFNRPTGAAFSADLMTMYVASQSAHVIHAVILSTGAVSIWVGGSAGTDRRHRHGCATQPAVLAYALRRNG